jgi:hypothetical protein
MSKLGESLAIVEVDLDFEKADWAEEATHIELRAITEMMHKEKLVFPVYAASLAPNGTGCLYLFANHDSAEGHVVAVHEPKGMGAISDPLPVDGCRRSHRQNYYPGARRVLVAGDYRRGMSS